MFWWQYCDKIVLAGRPIFTVTGRELIIKVMMSLSASSGPAEAVAMVWNKTEIYYLSLNLILTLVILT